MDYKDGTRYPIKFWRSLWDILACWMVIGACIGLCIWGSWWFYPVALVVIANRLLALSLVCHEGLHGTLSHHRRWNDFLGRYFCAYPTLISFSRYRRLHLLHHGALSGKNWDPDRHLYSDFPVRPGAYFSDLFWRVITFKNSWSFMQYYTDIPELMKIRGWSLAPSRLHKSSDWKSFLLFQVVMVGIVVVFHWEYEFILFYWLPIILVMQPYVILMGGLQHGPVRHSEVSGGPSRTIVGSGWYMWLALPLNINYHGEHHHNPEVPHYHLKKYSEDLEHQGTYYWRESYLQALRALFSG
jgi:fatty acid desaturase